MNREKQNDPDHWIKGVARFCYHDGCFSHELLGRIIPYGGNGDDKLDEVQSEVQPALLQGSDEVVLHVLYGELEHFDGWETFTVHVL